MISRDDLQKISDTANRIMRQANAALWTQPSQINEETLCTEIDKEANAILGITETVRAKVKP